MKRMSEYELNSAYWWFSNLAIWIPIIGLLVGAMCAFAARQVNGQLSELVEAREAARLRRSAVERKQREATALAPPAPAPPPAQEKPVKPAQLPEATPTALRTITAEQRRAFIQATARAPKGFVSVSIYSAESEIADYATQIRDMVTSAGFDTGIMVEIDPNAVPTVGVALLVNDRLKPPPFAGIVQNAFNLINVKTEEQVDLHIPDNEVKILVGRRR